MRSTSDEPKRYIRLRYPESFVQKIRLAADSKNMRVADYLLNGGRKWSDVVVQEVTFSGSTIPSWSGGQYQAKTINDN